ncbi:zinc-dependent peptidase [Salibacter halophilus]|uniref:Zinc-dependent peptidase n=1 Tax=Salibacter halophilus TaxID=1803916 RepID=A0A6N6M2J9_9FLAO|nr:zinc-dependent peptidase [Salibacter halophilus]KAB1063412.1 zinc-dependent peptidase [Salibacter halophilus]
MVYAIFLIYMILMVFLFDHVGIHIRIRNLFKRGMGQEKANFELTKDNIARADSILNKHMEFYQNLSKQGKERFLKRLVEVERTKSFYGKDGLEITSEVIVLLCGSIVQLTWGLDEFRLPSFKYIFVYHDIFYQRLIRKNVKGCAIKTGYVMLSWRHVKEGYADENDKLNLALHEFAHALKLEALHRDEHDQRFYLYIPHWLRIAEKSREKMLRSDDSFLRKYAEVNGHEFFAVSVEHFFEDPKGFYKHMPNTFNRLVVLLRVNPLDSENDFQRVYEYVADENKNDETLKIPYLKNAKPVHISTLTGYYGQDNILILGIILGVPALVVTNYNSEFRFLDVIELILIAVVLIGAWVIYRTGSTFRMKSLFSMISVGGGLLATAIFFVLNMSYTLEKQDVIFKVAEKEYDVKTRDYDITLESEVTKPMHVQMTPREFKNYTRYTDRYIALEVELGLFGVKSHSSVFKPVRIKQKK